VAISLSRRTLLHGVGWLVGLSVGLVWFGWLVGWLVNLLISFSFLDDIGLQCRILGSRSLFETEIYTLQLQRNTA
jgi:hypothetical protein